MQHILPTLSTIKNSTCRISILTVQQHVNHNISINKVVFHYSKRPSSSFL